MRIKDTENLLPIGSEADDLFEMANLYPRETGLPMTIWVSPRGNARHDVRIGQYVPRWIRWISATQRSSGFVLHPGLLLVTCPQPMPKPCSNGSTWIPAHWSRIGTVKSAR